MNAIDTQMPVSKYFPWKSFLLIQWYPLYLTEHMDGNVFSLQSRMCPVSLSHVDVNLKCQTFMSTLKLHQTTTLYSETSSTPLSHHIKQGK